MKDQYITREQARVFAAVFSIAEIKAYADANKEEYAKFLAEETEKKEAHQPKQRISRKGGAK